MATYINVRNWQSTQSCIHEAVCVRWPWQLWCTQSAHSVNAVDLLSSCTWSDEKTSIGRKTANSNHDAICRLFSSFMAAKVVRNTEILLFLHKDLALFITFPNTDQRFGKMPDVLKYSIFGFMWVLLCIFVPVKYRQLYNLKNQSYEEDHYDGSAGTDGWYAAYK